MGLTLEESRELTDLQMNIDVENIPLARKQRKRIDKLMRKLYGVEQ